jgi:hypothetical protein
MCMHCISLMQVNDQPRKVKLCRFLEYALSVGFGRCRFIQIFIIINKINPSELCIKYTYIDTERHNYASCHLHTMYNRICRIEQIGQSDQANWSNLTEHVALRRTLSKKTSLDQGCQSFLDGHKISRSNWHKIKRIDTKYTK